MVQTGLLGTIAIIAAILMSLMGILRSRRTFALDGEFGMFWLSSAIVASLLAFMAGAFFLTSSTHKEFWLLLSLSGAVTRLSNKQEFKNAKFS